LPAGGAGGATAAGTGRAGKSKLLASSCALIVFKITHALIARSSPRSALVMHFFDSSFCGTEGEPIICTPQMTIMITARIPAMPMIVRTIPSR